MQIKIQAYFIFMLIMDGGERRRVSEMSGCKFMLTKSGIMQINVVVALVACILSSTLHACCRLF